jgi:hypothetical protein
MYPHFLFLSFKKRDAKMTFVSQNFPISLSNTNCHKTMSACQKKKKKKGGAQVGHSSAHLITFLK